MKIDYAVPYINVKFTSVKGDKFEIENGEFGGDIISLTTMKNISSPNGSFTLNIIARDNYQDYFSLVSSAKKTNAYDIFRAPGIVDIYINGKEQMIGIIDTVQRECSIQGKTPTRSISISGRDLGAFLADHQIWEDISMSGGRIYNYAIGEVMESLGILGGESPASLIMRAVNTWLIAVINQFLPDYNNQFQFADKDKMQDKLIAMSEIESSYDVKQRMTVQTPIGARTAGYSLGKVKGPGALSEISYGDYYPLNINLWGYGGNLWNFIQTMISVPFNELFVETGDAEVVLGYPRVHVSGGRWRDSVSYYSANFNKGEGKTIQLTSTSNPKRGLRICRMKSKKAYLVFRPCPFDDIDRPACENSADLRAGIQPIDMDSMLTMQDLKEFKIDDSVIVKKSLNLSKNDIPSLYRVMPSQNMGNADASKGYSPAKYDERALRRYGYKPLEVKLDSYDLNTKNLKEGDPIDVSIRFQKKLQSWYENSDRFLEGTIIIKGDEKIRIGNRLSYEKLNGEIECEHEEGKYYITGVNQNYIFGKSFTTNLTLERGMCPKIMEK